jgi:hypothetical protein
VNKIAIDAGFTCPNRDGTKGKGGCTYCNNESFSPVYVKSKNSIKNQIRKGIDFHSSKGGDRKYLAYFQSYTNTYSSVEELSKLYYDALSQPEIVGLVVGTRPDCVNDEVLNMLKTISESHYVVVEYGVESTLNRSLKLINRGHDFEETVDAITRTHNKGLVVGAHIILGLPGESETEMMEHATRISKLPVQFLKIHHLQIIRKTIMARDYLKNPDNYSLFSLEEYVPFVAHFIAKLRSDIVVERVCSASSNDLLIAPKWGGIRNADVMNLVKKHMNLNDLYQGKNFGLPV